ncbi:MAG TPA: CmcI family methyltransferase [Solirubrobacteraceae bacterium]
MVGDRALNRLVARLYHYDLIYKTRNFETTSWVGVPIWQNILDLWTLQETICEIRPSLLVETGTYKGGSAMYYAHLMDLLGEGRIITIDVAKQHDLEHQRITFLNGSSTDPDVAHQVLEAAADVDGPVMVILDGNHARDHVAQELELYAALVTPGSVMLSQDGVIDQLWMFRDSRPGPLGANREFLARHPEFEYDAERNERFRLTHHPMGWMRRLSP